MEPVWVRTLLPWNELGGTLKVTPRTACGRCHRRSKGLPFDRSQTRIYCRHKAWHHTYRRYRPKIKLSITYIYVTTRKDLRQPHRKNGRGLPLASRSKQRSPPAATGPQPGPGHATVSSRASRHAPAASQQLVLRTHSAPISGTDTPNQRQAAPYPRSLQSSASPPPPCARGWRAAARRAISRRPRKRDDDFRPAVAELQAPARLAVRPGHPPPGAGSRHTGSLVAEAPPTLAAPQGSGLAAAGTSGHFLTPVGLPGRTGDREAPSRPRLRNWNRGAWRAGSRVRGSAVPAAAGLREAGRLGDSGERCELKGAKGGWKRFSRSAPFVEDFESVSVRDRLTPTSSATQTHK